MNSLTIIDSEERRVNNPRVEIFDGPFCFGKMVQITQGEDLKIEYKRESSGCIQLTKTEAEILLKTLKKLLSKELK